MNTIIELLKNRRIWVVLIGVFMAAFTAFGYPINIDQNTLTDLIVKLASTLADLVVAGLALWSFLKPKN